VVALRRRVPYLDGLVRDATLFPKAGTRYSEVLRTLLEHAKESIPSLDVDARLQEITERENDVPTAIGNGVAIPHIYATDATRSQCFVATVTHGVETLGPDNDPIHLVFLVVSPQDGAGHHLRCLAALAHLAGDRGFVDVLREQSTRSRVLSLLRERE